MNNYSQMPLSAVESQFKTWSRHLITHQTTNLFFLKNTGLLPRLFQFRDYFNTQAKAKVQIIDLDAENISTTYDLQERLKSVKSHIIILAREKFLMPDSSRLEPTLEHFHTNSPYRMILVHECAPHELYTTFDRASVLYVKPTIYKLPTNLLDLRIYTQGVIKLWDMQLTDSQIEDCICYCGNIAWLINEYIRLQSEFPGHSLAQIIELPSLKYRVRATFESLPKAYKDHWNQLPIDAQIIKEMYDSGIIDSTGKPIGQYLVDSIKYQYNESIQTTPQKIIFNNIDQSSFFTPGELRLINLFIKNHQPVSRETVANTLYPSGDLNYSDWALSQSISRLRTKLNKHKIPLHITPVRGTGYVSNRT